MVLGPVNQLFTGMRTVGLIIRSLLQQRLLNALIQRVAKGTSDNQKSRCRLAESTPLLTRRQARSKW